MCNKEGLQIDKCRSKYSAPMVYKQNGCFYVKPGKTQASRIAPSTSSALFWMKWSWLGIWGIGVRPDTGYGLASKAKRMNSETFKKQNHKKW